MKSFPELSWFQRNASEKSAPNDTRDKPSPHFQGGSVVKNLLPGGGDARDPGSISGSERSLEEEMATHSSILA